MEKLEEIKKYINAMPLEMDESENGAVSHGRPSERTMN